MNVADIATLTRFLSDADSDSYSDANLLINLNQAYEEEVGKILGYDGRWDFDDTNFTDFPIATTDLVNSQNDYEFDVTHLKIIGVSVKDVNGEWYKLTPFDPDDTTFDRDEFYETDGRPLYYDKLGTSLVMYPAPDNGVSVTLTGGLKVYYQRTASIFSSSELTAGTKIPGFASPFHAVLAYKAAVPYCLKYKPERVGALQGTIATLEHDMEEFYTKRDKDERPIMTMKQVNFR